MRITLDRALFSATTEAESLVLLQLLLGAALTTFPRPCVLLDPPWSPGDGDQALADWLSARGAPEARAFRSLFDDSLLTRPPPLPLAGLSDSARPRRWHLAGALAVRVERRAQSDWAGGILTLADALDLLREPVHLFLENERTDWEFLIALAGPTDGPVLRDLLDRPSRVQLHSQAGDVKKWLEKAKASPGDPVLWRRVLRTFVLFDRDSAEHDARHPSSTAQDLCSVCCDLANQRSGRPAFVCLLRREIESYTPDAGLRTVATSREQVHFVTQVIAWRAAGAASPAGTPDQTWAWSIDLKKGLRGDLHAAVPQAVRQALKDRAKSGMALLPAHLKAPFSSLDPATVTVLDEPLHDRLGKTLREEQPRPGWLADLPAEYDRGPADQAPRAELIHALFARM